MDLKTLAYLQSGIHLYPDSKFGTMKAELLELCADYRTALEDVERARSWAVRLEVEAEAAHRAVRDLTAALEDAERRPVPVRRTGVRRNVNEV